ncbi:MULTISPECIES: toxin VasX, partial [unclassified Gilliamella]|uniref:toxin VasX n=1 Tax=unclassified Gilliamella TaxID=2685620 RepID=UPI00226A862C
LLRKSVIRKKAWNVPWSNKVPEDVAKQPKNLLKEHEYTLRNVRQGYIYVLVESKEGNKEFLGYEVTPEGAFRQRPLENMVINKCEPMSASCIKSNHHVPASFINIDTNLYQKAWIAYSKYPWTEKIREKYLSGEAALDRFTYVDLSEEAIQTISPDQIRAKDLFMMAEGYNKSGNDNADFSTSPFPLQPELVFEDLRTTGFYTIHHFESRKESNWDYFIFASNMEEKYNCQVPVVLVEDNFGIVEELNYQREVKNNYTGEKGLNGKLNKKTGVPFIYSQIYDEECQYKFTIQQTIDGYEKSLEQFFKERSSGYIRETIINLAGGGQSTNLTRSEIDICTNSILAPCEFIPQEKSAELNFQEHWKKLKAQLDMKALERFRSSWKNSTDSVNQTIQKYSRDYANYARWLFGREGMNSKLSKVVISERNKTRFWEVEFNYQLKPFHKFYLDDAHTMLSSHIPPTDDVKALQDELCSDPDSYYYQVLAGDDKDLFGQNDSDTSENNNSSSTSISTESSGGDLDKVLADSMNNIFGADIDASDGDILLAHVIRNHILSLSTDVTSGIATEYRNSNVLLNETLISGRLKQLAAKIADGKVTEVKLKIRMPHIAEVFESIGKISVTGGVNFKTNLKTATGDNLYFNKADSKFYIMDLNGKSRGFTRAEYDVLKQKTVTLDVSMVTENARVPQNLLDDFKKLANEDILPIQKFRRFVARVPQDIDIAVMANGDELQASLLKEMENKKLNHVPTENQKIIVNGLAKCFLNVVMLGFTLKGLEENRKLLESETDPIARAFLFYDFCSGHIALCGMTTEVVGHIIRMATAKTALRVSNFLTRFPHGESRLITQSLQRANGIKNFFNITNNLLNIAGKGLALLTIVDGAMEIFKGFNLMLREGEIAAGGLRILGGITIGIGAAFSLGWIELALPSLMVTGIGIAVAVAGIIIIYIASFFERTKLERWFARCGFGVDQCRYPLTKDGLKKALNDFAFLTSGMSPQLKLKESESRKDVSLIGGFEYKSLYLSMTIHNFDKQNDELQFIVTINDKIDSKKKVILELTHNPETYELESKLVEYTFDPLSVNRKPTVSITPSKGRFYKYQSEEVDIDNSDKTLKVMEGTITNLVINFKLAEIDLSAIQDLLFAVELMYQKPKIINDDKIEQPAPVHQYHEFEGKSFLIEK